MRRVRVLLVEDHDFTRSTVAAALRAEQCNVVASVASAKDALRAASENEVDCAVIDLNLGIGPTGIDRAVALRQKDADVGIVLLTSYADPRLLSDTVQSLPDGAVFAVKSDVHSTGQLRARIDVAIGDVERPHSLSEGRLALTDNQIDLLRLVASGLTNSEIAKRRVVSERAVETALARTIHKLGIVPRNGENPRSLAIQAYFSLIGGSSGR